MPVTYKFNGNEMDNQFTNFLSGYMVKNENFHNVLAENPNSRLYYAYRCILSEFISLITPQEEKPESFKKHQREWIQAQREEIVKDLNSWHNISRSDRSKDPDVLKMLLQLNNLVAIYAVENKTDRKIKNLTTTEVEIVNKKESKEGLLAQLTIHTNDSTTSSSIPADETCCSGCVIA